jgi:hypothetical protein
MVARQGCDGSVRVVVVQLKTWWLSLRTGWLSGDVVAQLGMW